MALFSERRGITPAKALQRDSMDAALRNQIWNALTLSIWDKHQRGDYGDLTRNAGYVELLGKLLWVRYFNRPIDEYPGFDSRGTNVHSLFKKYVINEEWYAVYDFVESVVAFVPQQLAAREDAIEALNRVLENEKSAYRMVGGQVTEITDDTEIDSVEEALATSQKLARTHLQAALEKLSDRNAPDYRNSIKESITAVESVCKNATGLDKATLGDCLRTLREKAPMHKAFESALSSLYGYTSDEGGIRHALTDKSVTPGFADAKFMLVVCSAYCNFVTARLVEKPA